jgi:hypothetical protein
LALRQRTLPSHANTKISQANRDIEETLMKDLNKIVDLIRKQVGKIENIQQVNDFYRRIKPIVNPEVYDLLREAATKSYMLGIEYTTKQILKKPGYITVSDVEHIMILTENLTNRFWGRVQVALFGVSQQMHNLNKQELPTSKLSPNFIVNAIAIDLTSTALNAAVVNKGRKLTQ